MVPEFQQVLKKIPWRPNLIKFSGYFKISELLKKIINYLTLKRIPLLLIMQSCITEWSALNERNFVLKSDSIYSHQLYYGNFKIFCASLYFEFWHVGCVDLLGNLNCWGRGEKRTRIRLPCEISRKVKLIKQIWVYKLPSLPCHNRST